MPRIAAALALLLLFAPAAHALLTPAEQGELVDALDAISRGDGGAAASRAAELIRRPDTSAAQLEEVLGAWYADRSSTRSLTQWFRHAALDEPGAPAAERTQQALVDVLVASLPSRFDSLLADDSGPALLSDPAFLEDVGTRLQLLAELAFRAEGLSAASRRVQLARLEALVAKHANLLRAEVTLDVRARPRLAVLRAQLWKILRDLPRPFDAEAFIAGAGFVGIHAEMVRRYGILVIDNNGFDLPQLDAIQQVLTAVPRELHRLTHISQYDFLGNLVGDRAELDLRGSVGVNLAATPVYAAFENPFPEDVAPRRMRTFCGVLQHEIGHVVDELTVGSNPVLRSRRDAIIARAGREDPLQYLRSMFPPETFPDAPQELFASIANQYLTDSAHTLALALLRLAGGRSAPLDQFLFVADVFSQGRDASLFFAQDEECNYSAYPVSLYRDAKGRIERVVWPGGDLRFQLDREGFVVR